MQTFPVRFDSQDLSPNDSLNTGLEFILQLFMKVVSFSVHPLYTSWHKKEADV